MGWRNRFVLLILGGCYPTSVLSTSFSTSFDVPNLPFLELDRSQLEYYRKIAQSRHDASVEAALNAYPWDNNSNNNHNHDDEEQFDLDLVGLDRIAIQPPSTWKLPDFHDELVTLIHVTRGASEESPVTTTVSPPTPLFTPDECQSVIQAAESHFEGSSWTTLPSGDYQVAGYVNGDFHKES
jgi:hypothetical protein